MWRPCLLLVLLSGCHTQPDPCEGVAGSCLDIHVVSASAITVDELLLDTDGPVMGLRTSKLTSPVDLPVRIGLVPPAGASGSLTINLDALLGGVVMARGATQHTLVDGVHATFDLPVTPTGAGGDGGGGDDLTVPDGFTCTAGMPLACVNNNASLQRCNATGDGTELVPCDNNCLATPTPHCRVFTPHTPVTTDLLGGPGAGGAITALTGIVRMNTDTGLIDNFRAQNTNPDATESIQGIVYFHTATTGVFSFNDFTIGPSVTVNVTGSRSLAIVASNNITIQGVLDGRPKDAGGGVCAGGAVAPGGGAGGNASVSSGAGGGAGGGKANVAVSTSGGGGGGGGNGDAARNGGSGNAAANAGGVGGMAQTFGFPIVGGGGGGSGSASTVRGGGGGGAIHLVAGKKITIGGVGSIVGVNVSGCGGRDGIMLSAPGGGGAGGTIALEAPIVEIAAMGALVANGGGGGGKNGSPGAVSDLNGIAATGGPGDSSYAGGGQGGANNFAPGNPGINGGSGMTGGGSGGTVGFIAIYNNTGSLTAGTGAVISPILGLTSVGGQAISFVTSIDLQ